IHPLPSAGSMILGTTTLRGISGPGPGLMGIAPRSAAMVPSARIFCMRSPDRRNACPGSISKTSDLSLAPPGVMMIWLSAIRCLLLHKDDPYAAVRRAVMTSPNSTSRRRLHSRIAFDSWTPGRAHVWMPVCDFIVLSAWLPASTLCDGRHLYAVRNRAEPILLLPDHSPSAQALFACVRLELICLALN